MTTINLKDFVRAAPDFPKPGILFRDVTPLLANPPAFARCLEQLCERLKGLDIECIGALDARGFLFGMPLAGRLHLPFFPVRKAGKLPGRTRKKTYALEYGTAEIEIAEDAVKPRSRVALVDDLLATGGTMDAAIELVREAGAVPVIALTVIELADLRGRRLLEKYEGLVVESLLTY